jgi:hypothetical protein
VEAHEALRTAAGRDRRSCPLLLPTHFTATMPAAGVGKTRILIWQAITIIAWTTLTALVISGVLGAVR